ncbi:MAG TPA: ABC transporter substrate-binding protein [Thermomicrobiaceae bacterium]|nr:ABC transporter substrate-binding protein [Thermomicrobiaceae bacterium]
MWDHPGLDDLFGEVLEGGLSRRDVLQRALGMGLAAPVIAGLLAACGGSSPAPATSAAVVTTPTVIPTAQPARAASSPAASPAATSTQAAAAIKTGGQLTYGDGSEPTGLDPNGLSGVNAHTIDMQMFDMLLAMDDQYQLYPSLATSWKLQPDGMSYTLTLRKDVKFHDGTPFNADAVKFTLDRIKDPATKSSSAIAILGAFYTGTDVVDDSTVTVHFSKPFAPFLGGLSTAFMGMVSPTAVKKYGDNFPLNPVGSGPFMFKEWVQKQTCTIVKNPDYNWAPTTFKHQGAAYLDQITFRFVPEDSARQALLDTGEAQFIDFVPWQNVARVKSDANYQMLIAPRPGGPFLMDLNVAKPPFDQLEVRQAMNYAINKADILKTLYFNVFQPAGTPLSPATFGYDASVETVYSYDQAKAQQLLDQAGWTMGSNGVRVKNGQPFNLKCLISTLPEYSSISQIIQAQLKPLGITIDIQAIAGTALTAAERRGDQNIDFKIAVYQDPDIMGIYFGSRSIGGFNFAQFKDPQMDALFDQGDATLDPNQRKQIYAQASRTLMEKAPLVPIYYLSNLSAATNKLQGMFHDTGGYFWFYDAWLKG